MFYFSKVVQPYAHLIQLTQLIFHFRDNMKFFIFVVNISDSFIFASRNLFLKHK